MRVEQRFKFTTGLCLVVMIWQTSVNAQTPSYQEPFRPQYHFTPPENWTNDPNGMVYYNGEYHLFYQYNPFGIQWGHMSWGHAVSTDLLHWKQLPVALKEENGIMIFSGNAVVDWHNTSGLCADKTPCLIAAYTGRSEQDLQTQNIAYSLDSGRLWTKYAGNPVIDLHSNNFRDPFVFWHEETKKWIMVTVLADAHKVRFYGSSDLKKWDLLSDFGPAGATGGVWECPNFFQLQVDGNPRNRKWVLKVDLNPGAIAGGSGGQYFVGEFDGNKFTNDNAADQTLWIDYGKDFYASQVWSNTPDNAQKSRVWLGWLSNWQYAGNTPTSPWRGAFSIPRTVMLGKFPEGIRLVQTPVAALEQLRKEHKHFQQLDIAKANAAFAAQKLAGETLEIKAEFQIGTASEFGFKIRKGANEETLIGFERKSQEVFVDRTRSGEVAFSKDFPGRHGGPLLVENGKIKLHIFVDRSSVEVFANDGRCVLTELIFPSQQSINLEAYESGGNAKIISLDVWKLSSIW